MTGYRYMKKYRIDKDKNIGNVIFVVEGGRPATGGTELRLLKKIFADINECPQASYSAGKLCFRSAVYYPADQFFPVFYTP